MKDTGVLPESQFHVIHIIDRITRLIIFLICCIMISRCALFFFIWHQYMNMILRITFWCWRTPLSDGVTWGGLVMTWTYGVISHLNQRLASRHYSCYWRLVTQYSKYPTTMHLNNEYYQLNCSTVCRLSHSRRASKSFCIVLLSISYKIRVCMHLLGIRHLYHIKLEPFHDRFWYDWWQLPFLRYFTAFTIEELWDTFSIFVNKHLQIQPWWASAGRYNDM